MTYSLAALNQMDQATFTATLAAVFEDTPAIAAQTWHHRPFSSLKSLHQAMSEIVQAQSLADQLALLRAHPDLGGRVQMADASVQEQASVGLNQLTAEEYEQFLSLNQRYREKFKFPFIMAVAGQTQASILKAFAQRLENSETEEIQQALQEVSKIAWFRLNAWIKES
ncbi:2-oxo-4-hydroxy-4-carboxy-5-ureidoimidazoline decarboxylase [Pseudanabaena sp. FACHB-2040]|uniref:2-oxo-4-hydroxy-4-carboxy-5-ureidoimidazoline decarboxylase n=1 Tax=Pseudanabaena sp. FACHB-2040 TaxID=2692859 RepID=UPI001686E840|nr:2-oxo-4-hydroxy-4-carboxy-5-ureidoimidazoline decarboxylase [Pseudanabaena sp. FACHB-2040]MBD0267620.1 2-oxo-4-hydroxy-4-carboxy-5-ureidoimidazoline decarboxylase [Cyanobacteria bacterium Co-bin8]MBD2258722.1 2-oxo-4-hydroxy-4-carboxy-5-ureidoimidazoline decarboxylase [Pseudanabaena sp. FACHB-2040]